MRILENLSKVALLCAAPVSAIGSSFSPKSGITYTVAIPSSTASAGSGPLYLQLSALTSHTWVGLGIGQQMAGATMFIIYTSGNGNVTISPRSGTGHVMPEFNATAQAVLLEGSGVTDGVMTANVRYAAAAGLLDFTSASSPWISSWQLGPSLDTSSPAATITQHDGHDQLTFDLAKATIAADSNPFLTAARSGSGSGSGSGSSGAEDSGSAITVTSQTLTTYQVAHGALMASVFVVLLPFGALVVRFLGAVWLHAALQLFCLCAVLGGLGLGIHLAQISAYLFNTAHTIFGLVIICLFMFQPVLGFLHHRQFKKAGKRSYFGRAHVWYGRTLIVVGVVNGGLGLQLASNSARGVVAYSVAAGVLFIVYIVALLLVRRRRAGQMEA